MDLTWEVKSGGRFVRVLIVFVVLFAVGGWYAVSTGVLTPTTLQGKEMDSDAKGGLFAMVIFFIILGVPILLGIMPRLFNSKLPKKVFLDLQQKVIRITFKKSDVYEINFDNLSFAYDELDSHASLVFYETYLGTRGQPITNKSAEILSIELTSGWKKEQLKDGVIGQVYESVLKEKKLPAKDIKVLH